MIDILINNLDKSYSPYSKFRVSCVVETMDGKLFTGVNIENASFGATICAERMAIFKAISEGYTKFKSIHILCADSTNLSMPCFLCRQVMVEFFDKETLIYVYNMKKESAVKSVSELCPYPFSKEDII